RPSFLDGMNHTVESNAVIEDTGAAPDHQPIPNRLPGKTDPRSEVAQRDPVLGAEFAIKLADSGRQGTAPSLGSRPGVVIAGHHIAGERRGIRRSRAGRYGNRGQIVGPEISQVTVLVRQRAVPLPADTDVECQSVVHLPVVLEEGV